MSRAVRLIAAGVTPRVLDLFKTTKTDHLFPITGTVEEASSHRPPKARQHSLSAEELCDHPRPILG